MNTNTFEKSDTTRVKAVAIILMLIHHLYFSERLPYDLQPISVMSFMGIPLYQYIGGFGKICVSFFMFFAGYGTYKSYMSKKLNLLDKIEKLYFKFWKIAIPFIIVGFTFFSKQTIYCEETSICERFSHFNIVDVLNNISGLNTTYDNEWWFVGSYIFAMVTFPLIVKLIKNNKFGINLFIVIGYEILVGYIFPEVTKVQMFSTLESNFVWSRIILQIVPYSSCFWMGCIVAKDDILCMLMDWYYGKKYASILVDVLVLCFCVIARNQIVYDAVDGIMVIVMTVVIIHICRKVSIISTLLGRIGKQSTNMWLTHTFFIYYFYPLAKITLFPRYAFLIIPWFIFIVWGFCTTYDKLFEYIEHKVSTFYKGLGGNRIKRGNKG